jgi:hypothetical protein
LVISSAHHNDTEKKILTIEVIKPMNMSGSMAAVMAVMKKKFIQ